MKGEYNTDEFKINKKYSLVKKANLYSKKVRGVGDIINVEDLVLGQYIRLKYKI